MDSAKDVPKPSALDYSRAWGESAFPPTLLATLITAQYMRPFKPAPMLLPPVFLFTTYCNLLGYTRESAELSTAWSGLYLLLAARRTIRVKMQKVAAPLLPRFGVRGMVRGATMGVAAMNMVGGGIVWMLGEKNRGDSPGETGEGEG